MSLMKRLEKEKGVQLTGVNGMREHGAPEKNGKNQFEELKAQIHKKIIEDTKTEGFGNGKAAEKENAAAIEEIAISIIDQDGDFVSAFEKEQIISQIKDDVLGFGPINPLIQDPDVTEIMVNGPRQVYVERKGKLELTKISFRDDAHVLRVIERIVSPLGRRIDESSPMVDARLPDGSRVNAIIPPLSLVGPCITIRKFSKDPFQVADLVRFGTLTPEIAKFLESCVKAKLNIVVSGGTGSGKTTTLNVLSSFIPNGERVVTIEDAAELQMRQEHVITLETRPANIEGRGAVTMRDLVRNSLRMRPERIVVGEVRGGEALDMLQAMNTGHDGSLTTGHANSPRDMLARLETMVLMAGMDLPVRAIREQISAAVDLVVQQSRLRDGSRKITYITEVLGMEGDKIILQDIFRYSQNGVDERGRLVGAFKPTGIKPKFMEKLAAAGIRIPEEIFYQSAI